MVRLIVPFKSCCCWLGEVRRRAQECQAAQVADFAGYGPGQVVRSQRPGKDAVQGVPRQHGGHQAGGTSGKKPRGQANAQRPEAGEAADGRVDGARDTSACEIAAWARGRRKISGKMGLGIFWVRRLQQVGARPSSSNDAQCHNATVPGAYDPAPAAVGCVGLPARRLPAPGRLAGQQRGAVSWVVPRDASLRTACLECRG